MVECNICNIEAIGSSPICGSNNLRNMNKITLFRKNKSPIKEAISSLNVLEKNMLKHIIINSSTRSGYFYFHIDDTALKRSEACVYLVDYSSFNLERAQLLLNLLNKLRNELKVYIGFIDKTKRCEVFVLKQSNEDFISLVKKI